MQVVTFRCIDLFPIRSDKPREEKECHNASTISLTTSLVADRVSEGEENRRPLHQQCGDRGGASESDDISDIDARLNALQNFLRAAKEKAKAASSSRGLRA